jgi:hypothetical protein
MKVIIPIPVLIATAVTLSAVERETWYGASGKVVKVTRVEKSVERFVPAWERREASGQSDSRGQVQRTRSGYGYPFHYYGYGYGHGYSYGYGYRPVYGRHRGYGGHHRGGRSWFHFNGAYQKNGWSVRARF